MPLLVYSSRRKRHQNASDLFGVFSWVPPPPDHECNLFMSFCGSVGPLANLHTLVDFSQTCALPSQCIIIPINRIRLNFFCTSQSTVQVEQSSCASWDFLMGKVQPPKACSYAYPSRLNCFITIQSLFWTFKPPIPTFIFYCPFLKILYIFLMKCANSQKCTFVYINSLLRMQNLINYKLL